MNILEQDLPDKDGTIKTRFRITDIKNKNFWEGFNSLLSFHMTGIAQKITYRAVLLSMHVYLLLR
jgi:hypothetical protein